MNINLLNEKIYKQLLLSHDVDCLLEYFNADVDVLNEGNIKSFLNSVTIATLMIFGGCQLKDVLDKTQLNSKQIELIDQSINAYKASNEYSVDKKVAKVIVSLLNSSKSSLESYHRFSDNEYLKSIYITHQFSASKSLQGTFPEDSRITKLTSDQRWLLFYEYVVHDIEHKIGKLDINKKLTSGQKSECKKHKQWAEYEKMVNEISTTSGDRYFPVWLTEKLAINLDIYGEKVSWCGAAAAFILSKIIPEISGKSFASTHRLYEDYKNTKDLVYDYSIYKKLPAVFTKAKLKGVLKVGSLVTLKGVSSKDFGGHFAIVTRIEEKKINNKIYNLISTIEGNAGNDVIATNRSFEEIRLVLNLSSIFDTPKIITNTVKAIKEVEEPMIPKKMRN